MAFDRKLLEDIQSNIATLDIDEIKSRFSLKGILIKVPIFDPGNFFYRARQFSAAFRKDAGIKLKDIIYPPKESTELGRLNRKGQPMFYCSADKTAVFYELEDLKVGDEVVLTFWKNNEKMLVNNIGYTAYAFEQLGAKRPLPQWNPPTPGADQATLIIPDMPAEERAAMLSHEENREILEAISECFMGSVKPDEKYRYNLTVAIGEMHLGTIVNHAHQFAGILYPSVRMWANADNLALMPWYVDKHMEFRKAVHVKVTSRKGREISISFIDSAREFDDQGNLKWLGRMPNWTLAPGQSATMTLEAGVDADGDYEMSSDGLPCHWMAVDNKTALPIERK